MSMSKTGSRRKYSRLIVVLMAIAFLNATAQAKQEACAAEDRACLLLLLRHSADGIDNISWRDQTYRELAKTLAFEGDIDGAIALIDRIQTPDTQAMTIRGIGMAAAEHKKSGAALAPVFEKLRGRADKIADPPSYAIALTYIAMAQAFAGDDDGAWKTAGDMENAALRHKAFAETAEIQAERGDSAAAMKSIAFIDSDSFRNKAYFSIAKIFANRKMFAPSLNAANAITNAYKKAAAIQYILDMQKPREAVHAAPAKGATP